MPAMLLSIMTLIPWDIDDKGSTFFYKLGKQYSLILITLNRYTETNVSEETIFVNTFCNMKGKTVM